MFCEKPRNELYMRTTDSLTTSIPTRGNNTECIYCTNDYVYSQKALRQPEASARPYDIAL